LNTAQWIAGDPFEFVAESNDLLAWGRRYSRTSTMDNQYIPRFVQLLDREE
jgi:hypothetical protein